MLYVAQSWRTYLGEQEHFCVKSFYRQLNTLYIPRGVIIRILPGWNRETRGIQSADNESERKQVQTENWTRVPTGFKMPPGELVFVKSKYTRVSLSIPGAIK